MEASLSPSSLLSLSKTLRSSTRSLLHHHNHPLSLSPLTRSFTNRVLTRRLPSAIDLSKLTSSTSVLRLRPLISSFPPIRCLLSSAGGGGDGIGGGDGGGRGDGSEGGNSKVGAVDDVSMLSPDVIILDVGGMTCGGCAASVKRILESQPQVSSANVNLATETAIVWPVSEAKVVPNWQQELGEMLAKHLTTCGFQSNPRGQGDKEGDVQL